MQPVNIDLECRSDGSVTVNGQNFGATWSGNYITLPAIGPGNGGIQFGEAKEFLMVMANEVIDERGRIVDFQKLQKEAQEAHQEERATYEEARRKWLKTKDGEQPKAPEPKNPFEGLRFRLLVKWIDQDHIDLGGGMKGQERQPGFVPPTLGFVRRK